MAYQSNPPSPVPPVQRPPTRIVPTVVTLAASGSAGSSVNVPGSNARQDRLQFVITVMDPTLAVDLQTLNGVNFGAAFAQRPLTIETSDDFVVSNPNNATVAIRIAELYPDTGNAHGLPRSIAAPAGGGGTSGGGTTSGGTTSGGGTSGGGGSTQAGGGTQPR